MSPTMTMTMLTPPHQSLIMSPPVAPRGTKRVRTKMPLPHSILLPDLITPPPSIPSISTWLTPRHEVPLTLPMMPSLSPLPSPVPPQTQLGVSPLQIGITGTTSVFKDKDTPVKRRRGSLTKKATTTDMDDIASFRRSNSINRNSSLSLSQSMHVSSNNNVVLIKKRRDALSQSQHSLSESLHTLRRSGSSARCA